MTSRSTPRGRRPRGGVRLFAVLGLVATCLVASLAPAPFLLDRQAVEGGELWRLVTGHLVHASRAHFLFDVGVGAVLLLLLRWRRTLWLLPPFVGILVLALRPDLDFYTGLSGVLHGWTVLATVDLARSGDRLERGLASIVLVGVILKAVVESSLGVSVLTSGVDMGTPTVFLAHVAGVLGGLLIAGGEAVGRRLTLCDNAPSPREIRGREQVPAAPLGRRHTVWP